MDGRVDDRAHLAFNLGYKFRQGDCSFRAGLCARQREATPGNDQQASTMHASDSNGAGRVIPRDPT
jgi:hypothetical protein